MVIRMTEEPLPPYGSPTPVPQRPAGGPEPRYEPRYEPGYEPGHEPGYAPGRVPAPLTSHEQHFMLVGGLTRSGRWTVPRKLTVICAVGGVDLDLSTADLPAGQVVLEHFSAVGGVEVTLPEHVDVRIEGLRLLGGQNIAAAPGPFTTTLVIRSFGVVGEIRVRRA